MTNILQHPAASAIGESPDAHSGKSDTAHWSDRLWEEAELPRAATNRLSRLDRMTQALQSVQELLRRDNRTAEEGCSGTILTGFEREGLHIAMGELCGGAMSCLEDLRENRAHWRSRGESRSNHDE